MPYIGTCFRFYTQMRVQKKTKHLHIEFIVTSHNSVDFKEKKPKCFLFSESGFKKNKQQVIMGHVRYLKNLMYV